MSPTRLTLLVALVAGLFGAVTARAQTPPQDWPQRVVKFIVPLGPGGGADIGARLLANRLPARWGKPVVIENRPGADGLLAIQAFISANDDHVLLFAPTSTFAVHPYQYEKLPYVPEDLAPIARISNTIVAIAVPVSLNINTLAELVKYAHAGTGRLSAAVVPGLNELAFDYFVKTEGLDIPKVPYRDIVQGATDLSEGRLQVMLAAYVILQPMAQSGRIKVLAVNGRERSPLLPAIPTMIESGYPSLQYEGLVGLLGPRAMPAALRERISTDVQVIVRDPAIAERLAATAQVPNAGGPAEFAAAIDDQRAQTAKMAKAVDLKPRQ